VYLRRKYLEEYIDMGHRRTKEEEEGNEEILNFCSLHTYSGHQIKENDQQNIWCTANKREMYKKNLAWNVPKIQLGQFSA
jgi:hypothetical protein